MSDTPSPAELRSRIEAAYMANAREDAPRGALAWFARQARVSPNTVSRWMSGEIQPSGPVLATLELLEERGERITEGSPG